MDDRRFDELTKTLHAIAPRRAIARFFATGVIAVLWSAVGSSAIRDDAVSAKRKKKRKKRSGGCAPACTGKNCGDPNGCGGVCTVQTCAIDQSCENGACVDTGCPSDCAGKNCGDDDGCGTPCTVPQGCGAAQTCVAGQCTGGGTQCPTCSGDKVCNESTGGFCQCPADKPVQCEFNSTRCSANPNTDTTRCGLNCYDCAVSFAPGYRCCAGQCVNGCGPSTSGSCQQQPCGSSCQPCTGGAVCCNLGPGTSSQCVEPVAGGYCPTP